MDKVEEKIRFHHVGIAVNSNTIKNILFTFFGELEGQTFVSKSQGVNVTFIPLGGIFIELVYPYENKSLKKFIEKRGETIHHFCFEVFDLDYWINKCIKLGFKIVSKDDRCFFIHPKSFGGILVEFINFKNDDSMRKTSFFQNG